MQKCRLFTSGSEGTPKGVALSHRNIVANRDQLMSSVDFRPSDVVLNAMPMFHVFGFVVGTIMPLLSGMYTFYFPSPLNYQNTTQIGRASCRERV